MELGDALLLLFLAVAALFWLWSTASQLVAVWKQLRGVWHRWQRRNGSQR